MDLFFPLKLIINFSSGIIMKNFSNYFKKEKWAKIFHYVWISVQNEKIEGEAVDLEGQVQDRFVIE